MSTLTTDNPFALQYLMNETLFRNKAGIVVNTVHNELEAQPLKFWGANEKNILFLLYHSKPDYFTEGAKDAFLKILSALKLSIEDVAVFNNGGTEELPFETIRTFFNPKICIFMGWKAEEGNAPLNEIVEQNGIMMLSTYNFEEMLEDDEKKRAFWKSMKALEIN